MLTRQQRQSVEYRTGFSKGRNNGLWLSYNKIFPIPVESLSKDLARESARLAGMPRYSQASIGELKDYLTHRDYNSVIFKPINGRIQLIKK